MKKMSELEQFRKDKDGLFGTQPESPLTDEQKKDFKGLKYYPENPDLVLKDLPIELEDGGEVVGIPTSAGDTQPYKKLGKINFEVTGTPAQLTVFESSDGSNIFLSFRDKTNKSETYHDGRYIEVEIENNKIHELDLNYAYNPYCAYNDNFRCPITPEENTINVEVKAGEKRYH
jgi:uncharacterized protein (DUF1684 family)